MYFFFFVRFKFKELKKRGEGMMAGRNTEQTIYIHGNIYIYILVRKGFTQGLRILTQGLGLLEC